MGAIKLNRTIAVGGQERQLSEWGASLPKDARQPITINGTTQEWFAKSVRRPKGQQPVRLGLLGRDKDASAPHQVLVTNRTCWELTGILPAYRHRWLGTATVHRDGKQDLGVGECQLRNGDGQTRHVDLGCLASSAMMTELRQARPQEWAQEMLTTVGEACRTMSRAVLGKAIA